jgi:hypothetical protein
MLLQLNIYLFAFDSSGASTTSGSTIHDFIYDVRCLCSSGDSGRCRSVFRGMPITDSG